MKKEFDSQAHPSVNARTERGDGGVFTVYLRASGDASRERAPVPRSRAASSARAGTRTASRRPSATPDTGTAQRHRP